ISSFYQNATRQQTGKKSDKTKNQEKSDYTKDEQKQLMTGLADHLNIGEYNVPETPAKIKNVPEQAYSANQSSNSPSTRPYKRTRDHSTSEVATLSVEETFIDDEYIQQMNKGANPSLEEVNLPDNSADEDEFSRLSEGGTVDSLFIHSSMTITTGSRISSFYQNATRQQTGKKSDETKNQEKSDYTKDEQKDQSEPETPAKMYLSKHTQLTKVQILHQRDHTNGQGTTVLVKWQHSPEDEINTFIDDDHIQQINKGANPSLEDVNLPDKKADEEEFSRLSEFHLKFSVNKGRDHTNEQRTRQWRKTLVLFIHSSMTTTTGSRISSFYQNATRQQTGKKSDETKNQEKSDYTKDEQNFISNSLSTKEETIQTNKGPDNGGKPLCRGGTLDSLFIHSSMTTTTGSRISSFYQNATRQKTGKKMNKGANPSLEEVNLPDNSADEDEFSRLSEVVLHCCSASLSTQILRHQSKRPYKRTKDQTIEDNLGVGGDIGQPLHPFFIANHDSQQNFSFQPKCHETKNREEK
ncbi:hypothetical protein J6590_035242, partial [Homalodisca vitripennis]